MKRIQQIARRGMVEAAPKSTAREQTARKALARFQPKPEPEKKP